MQGSTHVTEHIDPRTARSRELLRDALAAEIDLTGDLSRVTVTAVSDRAGLTRRTFYSHFRDIPDLVSQVENETVEALRPYVAQIAAVHLDELSQAIRHLEPCPGSVELLEFLGERGSYLGPLLGDGGDPAFAKRLEALVREVVSARALEGLDSEAVGAFFDYYLTYAISAEVGVLVRWLTTGRRESARTMARVMTALMFVRPGDLYGKSIDFDVHGIGLALARRSIRPPWAKHDRSGRARPQPE